MAGNRNGIESWMQGLEISRDPVLSAKGKAPEGSSGYHPFSALAEEPFHHKNTPKEDASNTLGSAAGGASQILTPSPFEPFDLTVGEQSEEGLEFCPFKLIRSYPFMFVNKANQDTVGSFFKQTLLESHVWDFFYLLDPGPKSRDPLLLVPSVQFEQYLDMASSELRIKLSIPRGKAREKFFVQFGDDNTPLPRFLGSVSNIDSFESLKLQISNLPKDNLTRLTSSALHNYRDKIDKVYDSFKSAKSKRDAEAARLKRVERQKGYSRMVKRVQRYLGLRGRRHYRSTSNIPPAGWNVDMEVPFATNGSVRFVCVDIEAWERQPNVITEVGLAVLDTYETMDVPPGKDGRNWFQLVESYHFRIKEYSHMVNHEFVQGCPNSFDFGTSEFVSLRQIDRVIGEIIGDNEYEHQRPVIIVGHDVIQDLKHLKKLKYNVWRVPQISDEVDTQSMFRRFEQSPNGRGLATVCDALGISGRNFHNAGNDATYTMYAMISTAIKQIVGGPEKRKENGVDESNDDLWSDGEMDDGGSPLRSPEVFL
ncbi:hypothetical protein F5B20DRAFT_586356 [Whalleya microplaca]|nr:hypothetical protein F5B20DRAFT_586356 [Whalleya microplaca]